MGKRKRVAKVEVVDFELPPLLASAVMAAKEKLKPAPNDADESKLPNLLAYLTPFAMPDPRHKGDAEAKIVLRESIALVSFDRRTGNWKVTLSDKLIGAGGSVACQSLSTCLQDVELLLSNGAFPWAAREDY